MSSDTDLVRRVTTLQLLYYMPDHPSLLQEFLWQTLDVPPRFPRVRGFLVYWRNEIEAVIFSAEVSVAGIIKPFQFRSTRTIASC